MSKSVPIHNPIPHGNCSTSIERAADFCRRGLAVMRDGELHFTLETQRIRTAEMEFGRNRGGILYWNGARSRYDINDRDIAMFPPGCNVLFPKIGTRRAARRYA